MKMSVETAMLNKKLESLRRQYQSNIENMDLMRSEYESSVNKKLEKTQQDMINTVIEHDNQLRTEYEKEFNSYSDKINNQLNEKIEEMNADYMRLKNENDNMHLQMLKIETELTSQLHNINKKITDKDTIQKNEAQKRMEKAYNQFHDFSVKYPHEFFEPNAANALLMQMESTKVDFNSGFYEACMANSSNIEFQLVLFEERIKKSLEQWSRYFNQLQSYTRQVSEFVTSADFRVIKNDYFEKELMVDSTRNTDTLDFWSFNEYHKMTEEISLLQNFSDSVFECDGNTKDEKIVNFLKKQRKNGINISFEELSEKTDRITELHKNACNMRIYIHSGFTASYMRASVIARKLIQILRDERNGYILKNEFKDNDIRNEFFIHSEESDKKISVVIFPVSPDKIYVVNCIGIYVEHVGCGTPENLKATEENIKSSIINIADNVSIIFESNCNQDISQENAINIIKSKAIEKRKKELSMKRAVR